MEDLKIGDRVRLPSGEAGSVWRIVSDHDCPEPWVIVSLDVRRPSGEKMDSDFASKLTKVGV